MLEKLMLRWKKGQADDALPPQFFKGLVQSSKVLYAGDHMAMGDTHLWQHVEILVARARDIVQ